jgi:hypothetical protein
LETYPNKYLKKQGVVGAAHLLGKQLNGAKNKGKMALRESCLQTYPQIQWTAFSLNLWR